MKMLSESVKALAVTMALGLASVLCGSGEAGAMDRDRLVEVTRSALQEQEVLQQVAYYAYQHDGKIGEAVKGDYEILPERIIPWSLSDQKAVSVVKVKATRGEKAKMYTFALVFTAKGVETVLMYPGSSNADPSLFGDLFAPAKGWTQGRLHSKEVNLKDTKVIGEIKPSGWKEEWLWVDEKGASYTMRITFTTDPSGGTDWTIEG